jgi:hypothetical protein
MKSAAQRGDEGTTLSQSPNWIKAGKSAGALACVELRRDGELVALRNSRHPEATLPGFTQQEFEAFLDGAKKGEFDHLLE